LHGQPPLLAQQAAGSFPASGFAVSACNRVRSQPCPRPPSDPSTVIFYHSPVAPLSMLDQEAHELKPRQCLLLRSRLPGRSWACVIVASDCEPIKRSNRAIGRILLAELREKRQAYFCQGDRLHTFWAGAMRRHCRNAGPRRSDTIVYRPP
jgi:hypothetical protein